MAHQTKCVYQIDLLTKLRYQLVDLFGRQAQSMHPRFQHQPDEWDRLRKVSLEQIIQMTLLVYHWSQRMCCNQLPLFATADPFKYRDGEGYTLLSKPYCLT